MQSNDFCSSFSGESVDSPETGSAAGAPEAPPAVIPSQGDLLGDLLNLDLAPPAATATAPAPSSGLQMGAVDLLGGGLDSLVLPLPPRPHPHSSLTLLPCDWPLFCVR